ncbi:MAG: hypothetical protein D6686_00735 [Alphaproteobacteria bacterium]|nr:MAG: hypothetical protein D6686_00735 [Alphaproteobacteria bacterium]
MRAALALVLLAACAGPAAPPGLGPADRAAIAGAEVVFAGEVHDNPDHHRLQAELARWLKPAAIVFEMLPPDREAEIARLRAAGAGRAALEAALDWARSGWPDFGFYAAIMEAAPRARIYGAEVPRADLVRAMREGAAAVLPGAADFGLDRPLPPEELAARIAEQAEAHCHALPGAMLPGMVEAQRLRDGALAAAALRALRDTGGPVLVITGTGHARTDRGAPALLTRAAPGIRVFALGQGEADPGPGAPFDAYRVAPAPPRPDPCAALRR